MRNISFHITFMVNSLLLCLLTYFCGAQNYQISFTASGESTSIDSIKVENLTQCKSKTIAGNDILQLVANTGIADPDISQSYFLHIYPNPAKGVCSINFETNEKTEARFSLCSLDGKTLFLTQEKLKRGRHLYMLSGVKSGTYIIRIETEKHSYCRKFVCNDAESSKNSVQLRESTEVIADEFSDTGLKRLGNSRLPITVIQMQYNDGEYLKFTGISGVFRTVYMLVPTQNQTVDFMFTRCTDADSNNYTVVQIGSQLWMAENLKTTHYRNGDIIPNIRDNTAWGSLKTGAYSWYKHDSVANALIYGALYNWYAINDSRGIAPAGWHVASDTDWTNLSTWLGGGAVAGGKLKDKCSGLWNSPNAGATNETGFTGLPGGYRFLDGSFDENRNWAVWWTSTGGTVIDAPTRAAFKDGEDLGRDLSNKKDGFSVRCVRD